MKMEPWLLVPLLAAAVLPAAVLMSYIYKKDRIEKEPKGMLASLFVLGALTVISAVAVGLIFEWILLEFTGGEGLLFVLLDNFVATALVEEGGKFLVLRLRTWKSPHFNFTFDAVVYAVAVSLGFATLENICYVLPGDFSTAILRGVLAVPGHAIDGVFMGCHYGMAKLYAMRGSTAEYSKSIRRALLVPVLLHGFYDFCLEMDSPLFLLAFFVFEIAVTLIAVKRINRLAREDGPVFPPMP